jgi:hypothetical protein
LLNPSKYGYIFTLIALASIGFGGVATGLAAIESELKKGRTVRPADFCRIHAALVESGRTLLAKLSD